MTQFMKKESVQSLNAVSQIKVLSSLAWVTVEGDVNDYILKAGDSFESKDGHHLVIEALQDLSFAMLDELPKMKRAS